MAGKKLELGPIGKCVAANVTRYREVARFNYTELSKELAQYGRDIPPLGVRRIEEGARRVDVDDLIALALALNVSPLALLAPSGGEIALVPDGAAHPAGLIWSWAQGRHALPEPGQEDVSTMTPRGLAYAINSNPFAEDLAKLLGIPADVAEVLAASQPGMAITKTGSGVQVVVTTGGKNPATLLTAQPTPENGAEDGKS